MKPAGVLLDEATSQALQSLGIEMPTPAYLVGVLLFSVIGIVAFWRGRRSQQPRIKWLGLALMLYPYVIWGTLWLYVVGGALCAALWYCQRR